MIPPGQLKNSYFEGHPEIVKKTYRRTSKCMNKTWKYLSGLVLWVSGLVFGCLDVYFLCLDLYFSCQDLYFGCLDLYLGGWTCISGVWTCISGVWTCILDVWTCILGVWTCILGGRAQGQGPRPGPGPGPALSMADFNKKATSGKNNIPYTLKCVMWCFRNCLWNFAHMASPTEMTITTRFASKFCAKRRGLQPPIFFLELISWVTSGITEPSPECQPKLSYNIIWLWHGKTIRSQEQFF